MHLNIMLSCAGRQAPLVQAFVDALNGRGKVLVADLNPHAPAHGPADLAMASPQFTDPTYRDWCLEICSKHEIGMWISLLEDELTVLEGLRERMAAAGCTLVGTPVEMIDIAMDKLAYGDHLAGYGIDVPETKTLSQVIDTCSVASEEFVVKMRRGRGSRGLFRVRGVEALLKAATSADDPDTWIAQTSVEGQIYCIDVINDLERRFATCLIRKRLGMGAQETDVAETVQDDKIEALARTLSEAMGHQGCMDADIIEKDGKLHVIDINLRFGGSHIFSLVAGANIPAALIAWRLGQEPDPAWLRQRNGEILSRYSFVTRLPIQL